jgi:DNA-binding protein HU-beta
MVETLFGVIVSEVRSGRKVTVVGFGSFNPVERGARVGRNPRTGAVVPIPASNGVRFATGSAFKSALNPKEGKAMAVRKATRKRTAKKAPARKTAARKSTAKRTTKRAPARKRTAKKAPARKRTAKKAPARKRTAKKAPAKRKTAARKAPVRRRRAKKAAK